MEMHAAMKTAWQRLKSLVATYLANDDPLAAIANRGAFLVWSSQPLYPVYVWFLVGRDAWPSLLTWISTPFFFAVPLLGRRNSIAGRVLFVIAGVANTLLATKAFGPGAEVAWFLLPCLILALGYFRRQEWKTAVAMTALTGVAIVLVGRLGGPLVTYSAEQNRSLAHLNVWSVVVLSAYLVYLAIDARRPGTKQV